MVQRFLCSKCRFFQNLVSRKFRKVFTWFRSRAIFFLTYAISFRLPRDCIIVIAVILVLTIVNNFLLTNSHIYARMRCRHRGPLDFTFDALSTLLDEILRTSKKRKFGYTAINSTTLSFRDVLFLTSNFCDISGHVYTEGGWPRD